MSTKGIVAAVVAVVVLILVVVASQSRIPVPSGPLPAKNTVTVGAVLALTGPSAIWGETVKNGMELALADKPDIKMLYEDSQSTPTGGLSAYNLLQDKSVDFTISELSNVSVPLSKLALERKKPLLVSLVSATGSKIVNNYTTRYYTNPTWYATPAFTDPISPVLTAKKLAVIYRNDELGVSVRDEIVALAKDKGKDIVVLESFVPNEKDFRTTLLKVKNSGADVFLFVDTTPGEALSIVKTAKEVGLPMPMIETSGVFADLGNRKKAEGGSFYSTAFDFTKADKATEFKAKYLAKYGMEANFAAAFGYDLVNLIDGCKGNDVRACLAAVPKIDGVAGTASQEAPGDFVVPMHLEKVN